MAPERIPERLADEARRRIESHLDKHGGMPPSHLPKVESIRPWGNGR